MNHSLSADADEIAPTQRYNSTSSSSADDSLNSRTYSDSSSLVNHHSHKYHKNSSNHQKTEATNTSVASVKPGSSSSTQSSDSVHFSINLNKDELFKGRKRPQGCSDKPVQLISTPRKNAKVTSSIPIQPEFSQTSSISDFNYERLAEIEGCQIKNMNKEEEKPSQDDIVSSDEDEFEDAKESFEPPKLQTVSNPTSTNPTFESPPRTNTTTTASSIVTPSSLQQAARKAAKANMTKMLDERSRKMAVDYAKKKKDLLIKKWERKWGKNSVPVANLRGELPERERISNNLYSFFRDPPNFVNPQQQVTMTQLARSTLGSETMARARESALTLHNQSFDSDDLERYNEVPIKKSHPPKKKKSNIFLDSSDDDSDGILEVYDVPKFKGPSPDPPAPGKDPAPPGTIRTSSTTKTPSTISNNSFGFAGASVSNYCMPVSAYPPASIPSGTNTNATITNPTASSSSTSLSKKKPLCFVKNINSRYIHCDGCDQDREECHNVLFSSFCLKGVHSYAREAGRSANHAGMVHTFSKHYNWALQFHTDNEIGKYDKCFYLTPKCMKMYAYPEATRILKSNKELHKLNASTEDGASLIDKKSIPGKAKKSKKVGKQTKRRK